ncbi:hypothetical protein [Streptomyces sp. NPDC018059]|uniref:hypothetical protein n=1 Tax=Streptomyces sp. NPDC018059 TaxID=3365041 RepID=UPI0037B7C2AA
MPTYTPPAHAHQLYPEQLALCLRDSRFIHSRWATYSHDHCDPDTGRPHLDRWADHGQAVLDINALAREHLGP